MVQIAVLCCILCKIYSHLKYARVLQFIFVAT